MPKARGSLAGLLGGTKTVQKSPDGLVQQLKAGLALPFPLAPPSAASLGSSSCQEFGGGKERQQSQTGVDGQTS